MLPINPEDLSSGQWLDGVFSGDPALKAIEVAFLGRMLALLNPQAEVADASSTANMDQLFQADLARFQNPVFAALARALEASVPPTTGFGRFRGRD